MHASFKVLSFVVFILFCSFSVSATQYDRVDQALSLRLTKPSFKFQSKGFTGTAGLNVYQGIDLKLDVDENVKWYNTRAARISYAPAAFFALGAVSWPYRDDVREWRNRFIPDYHNTFDDILQYTPIMAVYGLNWAGVEGKHSLKRTTVTWAMSLAMMGIVVNGMKYSIGEMRPDGSTANSFPSGHTAMAFVSATMLHKEFGQYRSPLYSFFGYAAAGWTGTMRQLNNRHWISDVLVGAGIGILSTEVAYILADKIYDDKETNPEYKYDATPFSEQKKPSFLSVKVGFASPLGDLANTREGAYTTHGFSAGFEGAYFFNRNIGVGGEMTLTSFPIKSDKMKVPDDVIEYIRAAPTGGYKLTTEAMGSSYYLVGPYGYIDLSRKFGLLFNVGAGYSRGAEGKIVAELTDAGQDVVGMEQIDVTRYKPEDAFAWNTGGQLWYKLNSRIMLGAYTRFMFNKPKMQIYDIIDVDDQGGAIFNYTETIDFDFSHYSLGLSINAIL